jgi:large subunit ribosomal protein L23
MELAHVIKKPLVNEKAMALATSNRYTFSVDKRATKEEIGKAVEKFYAVHVLKVNTITARGKARRPLRWRNQIKGTDWKKAIVQLKEGEKIDAFEVSEK